MAKHFETTIEDDRFEFRRKEKAIAEEAALDGVYVVRTNLPAVALDDAGTVAAYKRLSGSSGPSAPSRPSTSKSVQSSTGPRRG